MIWGRNKISTIKIKIKMPKSGTPNGVLVVETVQPCPWQINVFAVKNWTQRIKNLISQGLSALPIILNSGLCAPKLMLLTTLVSINNARCNPLPDNMENRLVVGTS